MPEEGQYAKLGGKKRRHANDIIDASPRLDWLLMMTIAAFQGAAGILAFEVGAFRLAMVFLADCLLISCHTLLFYFLRTFVTPRRRPSRSLEWWHTTMTFLVMLSFPATYAWAIADLVKMHDEGTAPAH